MAMTTCRECKASISDTAAACPQCGAKAPKETSRFTILIGGLFAIGIAGAIFGNNDATRPPAPPVLQKTPAQIQVDAEKEARFTDTTVKLRALKASLKNPASFELVRADRMKDGTVCVIYRGTNSFNATTTEQKAIGPIGNITDFNKFCGGKSGEDHTNAKHAM